MQFTVVIEESEVPGFSREVIITTSTAMEAHKLCYFNEIEAGEKIVEIRDQNNQVVYDLSGFVDPF